MTKGIIFFFATAMIVFAGCKKSTKYYYYEVYEVGTRYQTSAVDSFSFIDSAQTFYSSYKGDTIDRGPDDHFYISGSYNQKLYQHFEVYRYTK